MRERRVTRGWSRRQCGALLALLLPLMLLGHDLAMAGDPHQADRSHQPSVMQTDGDLRSAHVTPAGATETPCDIDRDASLAAAPLRPPCPAISGVLEPPNSPRFVTHAAAWFDSFPHPSVARRALLQVWLI